MMAHGAAALEAAEVEAAAATRLALAAALGCGLLGAEIFID